jgi:hypothetical protein
VDTSPIGCKRAALPRWRTFMTAMKARAMPIEDDRLWREVDARFGKLAANAALAFAAVILATQIWHALRGGFE